MSVLLWVQTVCKGYQQTTKVVASKERVVQELNLLHRFDHSFHGLLNVDPKYPVIYTEGL